MNRHFVQITASQNDLHSTDFKVACERRLGEVSNKTGTQKIGFLISQREAYNKRYLLNFAFVSKVLEVKKLKVKINRFQLNSNQTESHLNLHQSSNSNSIHFNLLNNFLLV